MAKPKPSPKHPMQPLVRDSEGVVRFKANAIVRFLLDTHPTMDLNQIAVRRFPREDREQFAQLIGYSVAGFGDLDYAATATIRAADRLATKLLVQRLR